MPISKTRHKRHPNPSISMDECWHCQRAIAICKSKIRWNNVPDAFYAALNMNIEKNWVEPVRFYWCCYCEGWHLARAKTLTHKRSAERWRRKWLQGKIKL